MLSTNVLSYHNDNQGLGANTTETELTPASVSPGTFAKRFATALDGQVYAQPLYVSDVNVTVGDAPGPVHDQRCGDAPLVNPGLVPSERGIRHSGPPRSQTQVSRR